LAAITTVNAACSVKRGASVSPSAPLAVAAISSSRSLSSRIISTWHSGSPNRALYSISFGPAAVSISPA
jgi:hypothetical protein